MATQQKSVGSLKKGNYVIIEGVACIVSDKQTSRPGKHGHAKVRLNANGMIDGRRREIVMPGHDNIDVPIIDKRSAQVLSMHEDSSDADNPKSIANVMDSETYETFDLDVPADLKEKCIESASVMYWVVLEDKIMKQIKSD